MVLNSLSMHAYIHINMQAYRTYLGTRIVLAYLEIWTDFDRITVSTDQPLLLFTFQQWSEDLSISFDAALYIT